MNAETRAIRSGRGLWSAPGFPHRGWNCIDIEDLGAPDGACEACGTTIRYVHQIEHDSYPDSIGVGVICAGHLEGDLVAARGRERQVRATARRRKAWLTRRWKRSARGNEFLNIDGFNVVVFSHYGGWSGRVAEREGSFVQFLDREYSTPAAAKAALLDIAVSAAKGARQ
jgi:hypothetical protein